LNDLLEQSTQLQHEKGKVTSLTYSVDNTTVLAGTTEGTVKFWPTIIEQMSAKMCQWIEENISQEDWDSYIGQDITYNNTCPNLATNNSQEE
ncbi:MAG: WD40 repeat domain-containing protein, partial [Cyclobacteriaceae bacterium]|nr:WD40 repeat domain-containing protein [Cyclobacteriaceae bacterium]